MNQQEFENKRAQLVSEAENLQTAEEINAKIAEIEALDKAYDEEIKAQTAKERIKNMTNPFKQNEKQDLQNKNTVKYEDVFAKYIKGEELNADERNCFAENNKNILNSTTTTSGNTAVIPQTLQEEIIEAMGERHPVLKDIDSLHIKGFISLPKGSMTANVGWYDEGDTPTDASVSTGKVDFSAYDLRVNLPLSFRLKETSTKAFMKFLKKEIIKQGANKLAYAVMNGLGVPGVSDEFKAQPLGVVTALNAETNTPQVVTYTGSNTSAELEAKLRDAISRIPSGYRIKAYTRRSTLWNTLLGIKDATGKEYVEFKGDKGYFKGVEIVEEAAVPANAVVFGDFENYVFNFNTDLTLMQQDRNKDAVTDYTLYGLADGKPRINEAFALLKKS